MNEPRRSGFTLSTWQMLKLVLFAAIGSACLGPGLRIAEFQGRGLGAILLMESILIPLVWALMAFLLVRQGTFKEWLILALLGFSAMMAIVVFGAIIGLAVAQMARHGRFSGGGLRIIDYLWVVAAFAILLPGLVFLARRILPRRCQACGWWTRVWVRSIQVSGPRGPVSRRSQCLRCGVVFEQSDQQLERLPAEGSLSP